MKNARIKNVKKITCIVLLRSFYCASLYFMDFLNTRAPFSEPKKCLRRRRRSALRGGHDRRNVVLFSEPTSSRLKSLGRKGLLRPLALCCLRSAFPFWSDCFSMRSLMRSTSRYASRWGPLLDALFDAVHFSMRSLMRSTSRYASRWGPLLDALFDAVHFSMPSLMRSTSRCALRCGPLLDALFDEVHFDDQLSSIRMFGEYLLEIARLTDTAIGHQIARCFPPG